MRVGIDYRPALLQKSGFARYVANLTRHLVEVDDGIELSLFSVFWEDHKNRLAAARLPDDERVQLAAARFPGRVLKFLGRFTPLSVETWSDELDLFHFTDCIETPVKTEPVVCTIFNTSFLKDESFHTQKTRERLEAVAGSLVERATVVLTISEANRADIISHYDVSEDRLLVTPLSADPVFFEPFETSPQEVPHILMLGTLEPRKNIPRALRALEVILERGVEARMLIVGPKGWMHDEIFELLERPKLKDAVTYLGELNDHALLALLRNSAMLAYPALWEGFGLPVVEAMAAGIPVLTSDRGALKEVAGDGAHLVDPTSVEAIADGFERILTDADYRDSLSLLGKERAKSFSWDECARRTIEGYELAMKIQKG